MPSSGKVEPLLVGRERFTRRAVAQIEAELGRNRCVGLFGPRQVGKTTIARQIAARRGAGAILLDLRNPKDRRSLDDEQKFFAVHADKLVVLDEGHHMPAALDIVHRRLEHEIHTQKGATRFVVLGSSSADLQRLAAERLGARITRILIDPIHLLELHDQRRPSLSTAASLKSPSAAVQAITPSNDVIECDTLWLRGGFPLSLLADDDRTSLAWRNSYLSACEKRAPSGNHEGPSEGDINRMLHKVAASQGGIFPVENSPKEFRNCVDHLDNLGLIRVLRPWYADRNKQLNRRPKLFIRDSGLLHALRACRTHDELVSTPGLVGASWEGFCIEAILVAVGDQAQAFYYRQDDKDEIDLVLEFRPGQRWAIEIKHGEDPTPSHGFYRACHALDAERRMFVHRGRATVQVGDNVRAFTLREAVEEVLIGLTQR